MTVAPWTIILDPSAAISERTELNLNSGNIQVDHEGLDWGEASIKAFLAEQRFGEVPTDYRIPNRVITIPLFLGGTTPGSEAEEEEARKHLRQKIGLIQRQGGVLLRQRESGEPLYADIVNASITIPDKYGETAYVEQGVTLHLECLPDFYGEEVTLEAHEEAGQNIFLLNSLAEEEAVIAGDYPARARLVVTERSKANQRSLLWGVRSTFYRTGTTTKLFYECTELTLVNGAVGVLKTGAFEGKAVELEKPETETWHPFLITDIATGAKALKHLGSYRVWLRAWSVEAGTHVRLAWGLDDATAPTYNESAVITQREAFVLLDLGEIRIEEPPVGEHFWRGTIQVETGATSHAVLTDRIWLQPLDDGAGKMRATAVPASNLLTPSKQPTEGKSSGTIHAGTAWSNPGNATSGHTGESASVALSALSSSQGLALTSFGFAVGEALTVHGIEVSLSVAQVGSSTPQGFTVGLLKAGATVGTAETRKLPVNQTQLTLGGSNSLWGTTWTPAQINASGFGVYVYVTNPSGASHTEYVNTPTVTVYYSSTTEIEDAVLYSEKITEARWDGAYREDSASGAYVRVSEETGDLFRLPPSGLEDRVVQIFLKQSRGLLPENETGEADSSATDKTSAQIIYRPCYLSRI